MPSNIRLHHPLSPHFRKQCWVSNDKTIINTINLATKVPMSRLKCPDPLNSLCFTSGSHLYFSNILKTRNAHQDREGILCYSRWTSAVSQLWLVQIWLWEDLLLPRTIRGGHSHYVQSGSENMVTWSPAPGCVPTVDKWQLWEGNEASPTLLWEMRELGVVN